MADQPLPLATHLKAALRTLYFCLGSLFVAVCVAHFYREPIIAFLLSPLGNETSDLLFLSPLDPLFFILKIDFFVGTISVLPIWMVSIIRFVSPAFSISWWRYALLLSIIISLTALGTTYGYLIVVPIVLTFMQSLLVPGTIMALTATGYINFLLATIFLLVLIFQIPIAIFVGSWLQLLDPRTITSKRRYVYSGIFIATAVITPTTDIITLFLVAAPAIVVTELGCLISLIFLKKTDIEKF